MENIIIDAAKAAIPGKAGEGPAPDLGDVLDEYQRRVYGFVLRLTGDSAAADDITQETFIAVWRHAGGFRGDSSLKTWIFRIALNRTRSYWRWKKLRGWLSLESPADPGEAALLELLPDDPAGRPEAAAEAAELERRVQAAINALPPRQREVAALRTQELSVQETAAVLGMAEGTVKAHWFEARKKLESVLKDYL